jgi:phosphomannomutase
VVVNLSTSRITENVVKGMGSRISYTPVGEVNVIAGMRRKKAVAGGEGNGGVILPECHYGRDSLVGAALILALSAESKKTLSELAGTLPVYFNIKSKGLLTERFEQKLLVLEKKAKAAFEKVKIDRRDGLRFDFHRGWFQIRKSNTEPIYRVIVETDSRRLSNIIKNEIFSLLK